MDKVTAAPLQHHSCSLTPYCLSANSSRHPTHPGSLIPGSHMRSTLSRTRFAHSHLAFVSPWFHAAHTLRTFPSSRYLIFASLVYSRSGFLSRIRPTLFIFSPLCAYGTSFMPFAFAFRTRLDWTFTFATTLWVMVLLLAAHCRDSACTGLR